MFEWWPFSEEANWWMFAASAGMFVGSLLLIPLIVARIRPDYFIERAPPPSSWTGRHPALRIAWHIGKNAAGAVLFLAGIAMLVLPGQGLLTILIGVMMLDFPGKRRMELWMVRRRGVLTAINWLRRKTGRPPLEMTSDPDAGG